MGSVQQHWSLEQGNALAGRMRVVILEADSQVRGILRKIIEEQTDFCLVGESDTRSHCTLLLETYLPELLFVHNGHTAEDVASDQLFPVRIELGPSGSRTLKEEGFETLDIPVDRDKLVALLDRARTEICRRKLEELSGLLHHYVCYAGEGKPHRRSFQICTANASEIPAEHVIFISADGNYVQLHARTSVHEVRDTISAVSLRLDPTQFSRVHRSFIVNRAHVKRVVRREGSAVSLELSNGNEIPIGPNYRSEVERFEISRNRLTA